MVFFLLLCLSCVLLNPCCYPNRSSHVLPVRQKDAHSDKDDGPGDAHDQAELGDRGLVVVQPLQGGGVLQANNLLEMFAFVAMCAFFLLFCFQPHHVRHEDLLRLLLELRALLEPATGIGDAEGLVQTVNLLQPPDNLKKSLR